MHAAEGAGAAPCRPDDGLRPQGKWRIDSDDSDRDAAEGGLPEYPGRVRATGAANVMELLCVPQFDENQVVCPAKSRGKVPLLSGARGE
jgi:hypothetical protein